MSDARKKAFQSLYAKSKSARIEQAKWDAYYYLGTKVFKNKFNEQDASALEKKWNAHANDQLIKLEEKPIIPKSGVMDLKHMQAIHKHINEDVVTWAGKLRDVDTRKAEKGSVNFVPASQIKKVAQRITNHYIQQKEFRGLSKEHFVEKFSRFASEWNKVHPFMDGNGRANKVFLSQVADRAGWSLRLKSISPEEWNQAFKQDMSHGNRDLLQVVFKKSIYLKKDLERAEAFRNLKEKAALAIYPELAGAYAQLDVVNKKLDNENLTEEQRGVVVNRYQAKLAKSIQRGNVPKMQVQEKQQEVQVEKSSSATPNTSQDADLER